MRFSLLLDSSSNWSKSFNFTDYEEVFSMSWMEKIWSFLLYMSRLSSLTLDMLLEVVFVDFFLY
jgi:hypothetical protein